MVTQALQSLRDLLGDSWTCQLRGRDAALADNTVDAVVELTGPDGVTASFLVDIKARVTPRYVEDAVLPRVSLVRQVSHYMGYVVLAPWIAPRTRDLLR